MRYRTNPRNGDELSQLAFGCMRLPKKGMGIDQAATDELIAAAIEGGVNYFDTARLYPGSEEALGRALKAAGAEPGTELRERLRVATKLPIFAIKKIEHIESYYQASVKALDCGHIDYLLMHNMGDVSTWRKLREFGIEEWIAGKLASGEVRNVGFSFHGGREAFIDLLGVRDWDFAMLQFNYLDEHNQAGIGGVEAIAARGLPVFVMEPLRGGKLAGGLPAAAGDAFARVHPEWSLAEWGFRWVLDHPQVKTVLSGMNSMEQLTENLRVFDAAGATPLSTAELGAYAAAVEAINGAVKVPCTACGYCLPCPQGVDIPSCFRYYNDSFLRRRDGGEGYMNSLVNYYNMTGFVTSVQKDASKCTQCKACVPKCPQSIDIPTELAPIPGRMHTRAVKVLQGIVSKFITT
jgi:predicted aldo/keto reductase-like oxidoreductase